MKLGPEARALIAEGLAGVPRGQRGTAVATLAQRFGVSRTTVHRAVPTGRRQARAQRRPEYRDWVRIAVQIAHEAPEPVPLDIALRAGVESGALPPEAADVPLGTAYRVVRELGLAPASRRTHRLSADYPMQAVLIDASTSKHLAVDRRDEGGDDPLLRLHRRPDPASGYKNKPLPPDRRRLLVYGIWDMCTGYALSRYVAATGENAVDAMDFLCWALAGPKADRRVVLHGVPDDLWSDQGPLVKSAAARELLGRLGVQPIDGKPYAKERMGGVERAHRTRWRRLELSLFLRGEETIRLSELNARLAEFEIEENGRRASRAPVELSRTAAWVALTQRRPKDNPLRRLPPDPIETMAVAARRKIDLNGIVRWGGVLYESAWHDRSVVARRAVDGAGDLVLEDERTGEKTRAARYAPRPYGAVRTAPATPLDRLRAEPPAASGADVFAPGAPPVVTPFPARSAAAAPLDNPLDAGRCRDAAEAWRVFSAVYPHPLTGPQRARLERRFVADGLDRDAVTALAQELAAAALREAQG